MTCYDYKKKRPVRIPEKLLIEGEYVTYQEIADRLGLPLQTVHSRRNYLKKKLKPGESLTWNMLSLNKEPE